MYLRTSMFCKKCGKDAGNAKFCPNCGNNMGVMNTDPRDNKCKKCGKELGYSNFCPECGTSAKYQNNPEYNGKVVNKIAYGLIAILLGGFGIHRFYAGRIGSGIVYLIFFWTFIPAILGLIEGILAFTREEIDDRGNIPVTPGKFFI